MWTTANKVHMSRPRKLLLPAMARAIVKGIGVVRALDKVYGGELATNATVLA